MDAVTGEAGQRTATPAGGAVLDIETSRHGRTTVLRLSGSLDAYTVPLLTARIDAAFTSGAYNLVVGLAGVPFLDSEGIGVLLRARTRAQRGGGNLLLAAAPAQARRTLAVKGLALVLLCFPSEPAAVEFLISGLGAG